jgi:hypothetical protein
VPLREWRIPTLIVSPPPAEAVFDVEVAEDVVVLFAFVLEVGLLQAFRRRLVPRVAEP